MSTVHAHPHPALQAIAVDYGQEKPSLSIPTDSAELPWTNRVTPSNSHQGSESFLSSDTKTSPSSAAGVASAFPADALDLGTARTFVMPIRPKPAPPRSNSLKYGGYDHGAPLSDIGEEELTPRSKKARSRTPSPTAASPTVAPPSLSGWSRKSEKRLSELSTSSSISTGSDLQWEGFDTRSGMSDRLRADLAAAGDDNFHLDGFDSRRDSNGTNGDDEITSQALSKRAEQILANAKMRLTNMEGNLSKARTSLMITPKGSPTFGEHKQAGGLYRSISQGGDRRLSQGLSLRKSRQLHSPTNGNSPGHAKNLSETSVPSGLARYPKPPEVRSASAMDYSYGGKSIDSMLYQKSNSVKNGFSPSIRWRNNSLAALQEEESSPSAEHVSYSDLRTKGLGTRNRDNHSRTGSNDSGYGLTRSQSQISTRESRDQMNGLRNKAGEIRTGQEGEQLRRSSFQNLRSTSPITAAEEWYIGAAEYSGGGSPLNTNAGMGWRSDNDMEDVSSRSPTSPRSPKSPRSPIPHHSPKTPRSPMHPPDGRPRDLQNGHISKSPFGQDPPSHPSTPRSPPTLRNPNGDQDDQDSYIQESHYEDAFEGRSDEIEEDSVAASEEEQIYLNQVLQESLQDAEPEMSPIPDVVQILEPERHEDRADAFDYENFFLHSALGNYSQTNLHRRNVSQVTVDSRNSYNSTDSVETTRAAPATANGTSFQPGTKPNEEEEDDQGYREITDDGTFFEDEAPILKPPNPPFAQHHLRSNSIDSVSSAATFATATEGGHHDNDIGSDSETDTVPSEILHWGERSPQNSGSANATMVGAWPSPPATTSVSTAPRDLANLPKINMNGYASPLGANINSLVGSHVQFQRPSSDTLPLPLPTPPGSSPSLILQQQPEERYVEEKGSGDDDEDGDKRVSSQQQQQEVGRAGSAETVSAGAGAEANTEILISALITLANPDFRSTGSVSELDKELVVSVLRSVGGVCEGIDRCGSLERSSKGKSDGDGEEEEEEEEEEGGYSREYERRVWRRRLDLARRVLEGEIEVELENENENENEDENENENEDEDDPNSELDPDGVADGEVNNGNRKANEGELEVEAGNRHGWL